MIRALRVAWAALAQWPRLRSTADLTAERDRLAAEIAGGGPLTQRIALLARVGPIARELHRRTPGRG